MLQVDGSCLFLDARAIAHSHMPLASGTNTQDMQKVVGIELIYSVLQSANCQC
jgi:hypothetical protein